MKNLKKTVSILCIVSLAIVMSMSLFACNKNPNDGKAELRFVTPDGTPALSIARLFSDNLKIGEKNMSYKIVPANLVVTEMATEKADIIVMPINAGAMQIVNNKVPYKLVSVSVEGSLYIVGSPSKVGGRSVVTLDDLKGKKVACIGQGGTPDLVFKYILDKNEIQIGEGAEKVHIQYVTEAPQAKAGLINGTFDFALVGEPAATAFGTPAGGGFSARLDVQAEYKKASVTETSPLGADNFPQAGLFVKNYLLEDATFMAELKTALDASVSWVIANPSLVTEHLKSFGSTSTFPAPSISRCNISSKFVEDSDKEDIISFLKIVNVTATNAIFYK